MGGRKQTLPLMPSFDVESVSVCLRLSAFHSNQDLIRNKCASVECHKREISEQGYVVLSNAENHKISKLTGYADMNSRSRLCSNPTNRGGSTSAENKILPVRSYVDG